MFDYDAELRRYHARLLEAFDLDPDARVLDVGCGTGQTTRAAGRAATRGDALGIDISAPMLAEAQRLTNRAALRNVRFERGDVQDHPLPAAHFTAAVSRFGTMFFADPTVAFTNVAQALRPGGTFTQLVWQHSWLQEWHVAIRQALTGQLLAAGTPNAAAAFSLAEPGELTAILTDAGFVDVRLVEVREPVYYGADPAAALAAVQSLKMTDPIRDLADDAAERALSRLRTVIEAHCGDDGVWFDSGAWLVTARREW